MKKQITKNSPAQSSQFSKHLRMKLKQNRKIFAVTLLLQLLGIPAAAVCQIIVNCKVEIKIRIYRLAVYSNDMIADRVFL